MLGGKWTYRSYHNDVALIGSDAPAALALIFGEGVFDLTQNEDAYLHGTLDMGNGYVMTMSGAVEPGAGNVTAPFSLIGLGVDGTATAGWRYDYRGTLAYAWPEGVDQVPSMTGTVVRVNAHGVGSPAGVTASFIAVRHAHAPSPAAT